MAKQIQIRRGLEADAPTLANGELGWMTDSHKIIVGTDSGNYEITSSSRTRTVVVDIGGKGDYTSIKSACDYVATQSPGPTTRWAILALPGLYFSDAFTVPSNTFVASLAPLQPNIGKTALTAVSVYITAPTSGACITLGYDSFLVGLRILTSATVTPTAAWQLIKIPSSGSGIVQRCALWARATSASYAVNAILNEGAAYLNDCLVQGAVTSSANFVAVHGTGSGVLQVNRCELVNDTGAGAKGIKIDSTGIANISNVNFSRSTGTFFTTDLEVTAGVVYAEKLNLKTVSVTGGSLNFVDKYRNNYTGLVEAASATDIPDTKKGAVGQSADISQWLDSSDNVLLRIFALGGAVINENGADSDTRIEGDTDANLFYVDAGANRIGIGDAAPGEKLDVAGNANVTGVYKVDDVQVVSNRVIDADFGITPNTGDVDTNTLISKVVAALTSHGLIAVS